MWLLENKNIQITGGTGMIGSHLVELLSENSNVWITSHKRDIPLEIILHLVFLPICVIFVPVSAC